MTIHPGPSLPRRTVLGAGLMGAGLTGAGLVLAGAAGCRADPGRPGDPATGGDSASSDPAARDRLLAAWGDAVRTGDVEAESGLFPDGQAPSAAACGLAAFDVAAEPEQPDTVRVTWQLPEDRAQTHRLGIGVVGGQGEWLLTRTEPGGDAAVPLWWLGQCRVVSGTRSAILVATADPQAPWGARPISDWLDLADRAVATAGERTGRDHVRLWLQLASTPEQLARLGVTASATAAGGAWVMGDGPMHVVLDPGVAGALNEAEAGALLLHETVHVLTDSGRTDLPLWVEEGYAEAVTWADDEQGGWLQAGDLLAWIAAEGADGLTIPTDDEFAGADAYVRAWSLCLWMQDHHRDGWQALRCWYDRQAPPSAGGPDTRRTASDALAEVFGLSEHERLVRWRRWMAEQAGRRG